MISILIFANRSNYIGRITFVSVIHDGFASSMLFGTVVGSLADKSCITEHSPQYKVLILGRVLGGIATSLLFSTFESWLVAEHNKRGFDQQWLSITFTKAIFLGNGLMAILSGLFCNVLVDSLQLGPVAPFDAAYCLLAIGMIIILSTWTENYGDPSESKDLVTQFKGAAAAIASGHSARFYIRDIHVVFDPRKFGCHTTAGSPESKARELYADCIHDLFIVCLQQLSVAPSNEKGGSISYSGCIQLIGFCIFEACVGIFWPSIMKMRSQYIPEKARSTIMNFFRNPLNIFVCIALYNVFNTVANATIACLKGNALPMTFMFGMCSVFLFVASLLQRQLSVIAEIHKSRSQERINKVEMDSEAVSLNGARHTEA
ncbi:Detected protein of confused Function [Hibiscus syriacus]|uniref:Detected protein of confused Function n=1 Tax=Hibiscus syriacus TaxID=106335 RepID=A0A6A3B6W0_HIBSY|nr:Detected protein of confused Function [Hibiscus syriacus]